MDRTRLAAVSFLVAFAAAPAALAEEKAAPKPQRVVELKKVEVVGKKQIPTVVDVARAAPAPQRAELRASLVGRIEAATEKSPF